MGELWFVVILALAVPTEPTSLENQPPRLQIFRNVKSGGFHRELEYSVKFPASQNFSGCSLWINETIPASLYVNKDQLDNLRRLKKLFTILSVFVNVETPEPEASPHHLLIHVPLNDTGSFVNVTLPIHLRYHAAQPSGGHIRTKLKVPDVYLNCSVHPGAINSLVSLPCPGDLGDCLYQTALLELHETGFEIDIPVGNSDHFLFVQLITLLVTFSGSLFICKVLYDYRPKICK